jgi:hypothetical protein
MKSEGRKPSGREKDQASVILLEKLRGQLYSSNPSIRRQAAFHLSWMQEDGLEILREALFGGFPTTAKNAAAYGLRKMRGRMKKMSMEVLEQGLRQPDSATREICRRALLLLMGKIQEPAAGKLEIKEIARNRRPKRVFDIRQIRHQKFARNEDSS